MSSNEMRHLVAHRPMEVSLDLMRYGIDVKVIELVTIELEPIPQDPPEPVSTEGCEVLELPTEVVICDYPVNEPWYEIVPRRRRTPQIEPKENANGYVACK